MNAASRAPAEKDTRKMVTEIPTAATALRPAVADCGSVSHPGYIGKIAVTTYMHVSSPKNVFYHGKSGDLYRAVNTSLN